jgi:hypothetical protein
VKVITQWTIEVSTQDTICPGAVSAKVTAHLKGVRGDSDGHETFETTSADIEDLMDTIGYLMKRRNEERLAQNGRERLKSRKEVAG